MAKSITDKLMDIFNASVDNGIKVYLNKDYKMNNEYNIIVENELFLNIFLNHRYSHLFELQQIYAREDKPGILSVYVKYVGA